MRDDGFASRQQGSQQVFANLITRRLFTYKICLRFMCASFPTVQVLCNGLALMDDLVRHQMCQFQCMAVMWWFETIATQIQELKLEICLHHSLKNVVT